MNTMTAAASRMWMRPPIVYEVNIPSIHNAIKTTSSVAIMLTFLSWVAPVVTSSTHGYSPVRLVRRTFRSAPDTRDRHSAAASPVLCEPSLAHPPEVGVVPDAGPEPADADRADRQANNHDPHDGHLSTERLALAGQIRLSRCAHRQTGLRRSVHNEAVRERKADRRRSRGEDGAGGVQRRSHSVARSAA